MITNSARLSQVLDYWSQHRVRYSPSAYALLLCGAATELDKTVFGLVADNHAILNDMTGAYTSLTVVGWQLDQQAIAVGTTDEHNGELRYLHAAPSWTLGSPGGVYGLVNALDLPLNRLPLVLVSLDPWAQEKVLVVSLRDVVRPDDTKEHQNEQLVDFFATLFTACRTTRDAPAGKRLALIRRNVKPTLKYRERVTLKEVAETGVLAQLVEGTFKGLGFGGG